MQHYHLQEEFIDQAAEQALIAAVAHTPSLYFEFLDLLAPDVFATEAAAWRQIVLAIEADQHASLPALWRSCTSSMRVNTRGLPGDRQRDKKV
jgi:hypothetical protein